MLLIPCIHCGLRNASEFVYSGEAVEQSAPATATPAQWRRYLYMRSNPAGWTVERWYHQAGCRRFFTLERHTVRNEIRAARQPEAQRRLRDRERPPGGEVGG